MWRERKFQNGASIEYRPGARFRPATHLRLLNVWAPSSAHLGGSRNNNNNNFEAVPLFWAAKRAGASALGRARTKGASREAARANKWEQERVQSPNCVIIYINIYI